MSHVNSRGAPSRRTVSRGLAWTVPVIGVAAAAPAFATSICPEISVAEIDSGTADTVTITNAAPSVTIPANTTITWQLQNRTNTARTVTLSALSGLQTSPSITSFALAANTTVTVTFATTATWVVGATVSFKYDIASASVLAWNFSSRFTLSNYPSPISACAKFSACRSVVPSGAVSTFTSRCPDAAAPVAAARTQAILAPPGIDPPVVNDAGPYRQ